MNSSIDKIIFVAKSGTSREPMAAGIMNEFVLKKPVEILARGLVVQFPEPMNQKAEAVLISNGINTEGFTSKLYPEINPEHVYVLSEFVGDELEILDPYGGALQNYGLCYESLRMTIKKLVKILNEGE